MPAVTITLDENRTAVFPQKYSPGDTFVEDSAVGEGVVLRLVGSKHSSVVGVKRVNGKLVADISSPVSSEEIVGAIQADRELR